MTADAQEGMDRMPDLFPVDIPDEEVSPVYDDPDEQEPQEPDDAPDDQA